MRILCNCLDCGNNKKLEEPYYFKYHKAYIPIGTTGQYYGECLSNPTLEYDEINTYHTKIKRVICSKCSGTVFVCAAFECLWNRESKCDRSEICIDEFPQCITYSDKFISGHIDMMSNRFLHQNSHIPDPIKEM